MSGKGHARLHARQQVDDSTMQSNWDSIFTTKPVVDLNKCPDCDWDLGYPPGGGEKCTNPKCDYWFCY